jgi:PAS domain-containing protein
MLSWISSMQWHVTPYAWAFFSTILIALVVVGLLCAWTILRRQLFDQVPVAYEAVFVNVSDGILVLDEDERLMDLNPAAEGFLGLDRAMISKPITATPVAQALAGAPLNSSANTSGTGISLGEDRPAVFDVRVYRLGASSRPAPGA